MAQPASGELNRRIKILAIKDIPAMGAGVTQEYTLMTEVWAKHQPVGGAIFFGTKQVGDDLTDRFFVRRSTIVDERTVTANHVIEMSGVRYRVKRASPWESKRDFLMIETEALGDV